ncbi:MAG: 1-aminocyclopropane-1-carboxylate deaminase/D-cysteine desulfhydrase [Crocinitomicaceae bacterium]|nr:1-aminocyclopropane-1-carboxylate deaminase/D-cysteine desulfhydrase [Crocinitomicaceae bacterium]
MFDTKKSILQKLDATIFDKHQVEVFVKRDDLIHSVVSGNKWRKLKYSIAQAIHQKCDGIFTFGGAYSNHLVATAAACKSAWIKSIGFVRGEELTSESNATLKSCIDYGMKLVFISREEYALRNDKIYIDELKTEYPLYYFVPEGGSNYFGVIGCQEIWTEIDTQFDSVFVAQGTTTTSCGLLAGLPPLTKLHVVPVLKGFESIETMKSTLKWVLMDESFVDQLVEGILVHSDFHFGGYGKVTSELIEFIQMCSREFHIPLDPVYTSKAFYALYQNIVQGNLNGQKILFLHTGGLQGAVSYEKRLGVQFYV